MCSSDLIKETGCDAVKLEGGVRIADTLRAVVEAQIPVMGHVGLTPQSVLAFGGYKVQGKTDAAAASAWELKGHTGAPVFGTAEAAKADAKSCTTNADGAVRCLVRWTAGAAPDGEGVYQPSLSLNTCGDPAAKMKCGLHGLIVVTPGDK